MKRDKKSKFKKRFAWIKFILISVLLVVCAILLALSPVFNISSIEVNGIKNSNKEKIISTSGIITGENGFKFIGNDIKRILSLRYGKAEYNIAENNAYVKKAVVRFIPPGKVRIDITERTPVCLFPYLGTNLMVDAEQFVVDTTTEQKDNSLPIVKGIRFNDYDLGKKLEIENGENFRALLQVLDVLQKSDKDDENKLMNSISYIDINDISKIGFFIDSRIVVNLGELQDLSYKISVLKQILLKNLREDEKGLLDFTAGQNPVFIPNK